MFLTNLADKRDCQLNDERDIDSDDSEKCIVREDTDANLRSRGFNSSVLSISKNDLISVNSNEHSVLRRSKHLRVNSEEWSHAPPSGYSERKSEYMFQTTFE